jgi:hypothetical protein
VPALHDEARQAADGAIGQSLPPLALDSRERSTDGRNMTELEEAELRLRRARAQLQWAARQNDYELEEDLTRESNRCGLRSND